MKLIISIVMIVVLALLPLVPTTTTISYTTKVPEEYTTTETYTEYAPRTGEKAIWNENPAHTEWRTSIKDSIESAIPPVGRSGYFSIEQFSYMKPFTRKRQVSKIRLVDKVISIGVVEHTSIIEWIRR